MTKHLTAPVEPVLDVEDIQGIAVPGFLKPHQTLLGLRLPQQDPKTYHEQMLAAKAFVRELADEVSNARVTLDDRRARRKQQMRQAEQYPEYAGSVLTAVGFSAQGLTALTPGGSQIDSEAFRKNLAARSQLLGDPTDPDNEGAPVNWVVGAPGTEPDLLIVVAGDHRGAIDARVDTLLPRLAAAHLDLVYREDGDIRTDHWGSVDMRGHEHFGFDDGVSQPGIRGRASEAEDDFVTPRTIDPVAVPDRWLYGLPGQNLVWPGEFVIGYPASSADPLMPGNVRQCGPAWTANGSFLVFRRLRQDVGLFWRTMRDEAARLATQPGFEGMTDEKLASRLVGRWMSGAPVDRTPDADDPALGRQRLANNQFRFNSDTPNVPVEGFDDTFPRAKADPAGITCPWAAHIRKVNVRDAGSDMGGSSATFARRLLRVGLPFGKPLEDRYAGVEDDPHHGNRGLLFLSVQSSIEDQFEFLQARWMNDPSRPKMPGGHDVFIGQNGQPDQGRVRSCTLFGAGLKQTDIKTSAQWVTPTGGGYFFLPSISALKEVVGG